MIKANTRFLSPLLILALVLGFTSCDEEVTFEEPQPVNERNEKKFKRRFQGVYVCLDDSSVLSVYDDRIIQEWNLEFHLSKLQMDSLEGVTIREGRVYFGGQQMQLQSRQNGDSVNLTYNHRNVVFDMDDRHVLRYFQGRYFLNYPKDQNRWTVRELVLNKEGELSFRKMWKEDPQSESQVSEQDEDSDPQLAEYTLRPTKKEFKELLSLEAFSEGSRFQKVKGARALK